MCGIAGLVGRTLENRRASAVLAALRHRGPDGHGSWHSHGGEPDAWLGHTRLAILDLSPQSSQPMHSECGRWVIVFNGELYNFIELRRQLEEQGITFKTESDTEVLLKGLILHGPDFQMQCNGMWAFCLWDRIEGRAILGRDRFGKKPLFYTSLGPAIAFSSEMKGLYPLMPSVQPSTRISEHFRDLFEYEFTEECVVEGVKRLPAGTWMEWKSGRCRLTRWWCTLDHLTTVPSRYEEQVERFRELFLDAVKLRMRADVKIGTALSGGLDSSSTFCSMAYIAKTSGDHERLASDWQHGVCASFPGSAFDEAASARVVANQIGAPLQTVAVDPSHSPWTITEALWQTEDPYMTLPIPHLFAYRAIADLGIKVTLDGHGADELFCGYVHLRSAFQNASRDESAELLAIERSLSGAPYRMTGRGVTTARWKERAKSTLRPFLHVLRGRRPLEFADRQHPGYRQLDSLTRVLYELFHVTTLPTLLRNYDRYSMASGVEIRMPFLDYRVVSYVFSLPWTSKVGGGYTKRLLRDAMAGIVPDETRLNRAKLGWNAPMHEWLRGPLRDEMRKLRDSGAVAPAGVRKIDEFDRLAHPTFRDATDLWNSVLLPAFWLNSLNTNPGYRT
jgi:asparagine synthase (glutamine-hydrolysing)